MNKSRNKAVPSFGRREHEVEEFTIEGQLVSLFKATADRNQELLNIVIDGTPTKFPRAIPSLDAFGSPQLDKAGETVFRYSTVYDAVDRFYRQRFDDDNPIPVLCHQQHLTPVAVCRVCMVMVAGPLIDRKTDKPRTDEHNNIVYGQASLVPACHRHLDADMAIYTPRTAIAEYREQMQRLQRNAVELLMADHNNPGRHNAAVTADSPELYRLARRLGVPSQPRFPPASSHATRKTDFSSSVIDVDHSACVMCDRCIRSCSEIKSNDIIGRTGSGYQTRISFDLDQPMGESGCVECGECAISCPTDALTIRVQSNPDIHQSPGAEEISVEEINQFPLLHNISSKYLTYIRKAFTRRRFKRGDVVYTEGTPGQVAYLIENGRFQVSAVSRQQAIKKKERRILGAVTRFRMELVDEDEQSPGMSLKTRNTFTYGGTMTIPPADQLELLPEHAFIAEINPSELIFGEASCLNNYPRQFTVQAMDDNCSVIEIRRNIVLMLMRDRSSRELLEGLYFTRAVQGDLRKIDYFAVSEETSWESRIIKQLIKEHGKLIKVRPGQLIARQEVASEYLDLVRIGFVRVEINNSNGDKYIERYLGPGNHFGDLEILTDIDSCYDTLNSQHIEIVNGFGRGLHRATYTAMDHVELLRIPRSALIDIYERFPTTAQAMRRIAKETLGQLAEMKPASHMHMESFVHQGMANARNLLVIDLEKCTRCDECTKACSDAHEGTTRLIREGLRFDKYLVTSSCRSCSDPYCMLGCPVDAIHRGPDFSMKIENWCIGCAVCEENCPYGNINMHLRPEHQPRRNWLWGNSAPIQAGESGKAVLKVHATICDLCSDTPSKKPSCVYACPHDAAHRMSGPTLLSLVQAEYE